MSHSVRLIGITQPVVEGVNTASEMLAFCARVSSTANQYNHETGPKLIRSLITRQEWSPLEMVSLTMEIVTTRDIARQILRHRSFSFQEFSQRYSKVTEAAVLREARLQDHKDRQNSIAVDDEQLQTDWFDMQRALADHALSIYDEALELGIAKEVARAVLPEGMTESRLYMQGTLRSWVHYVKLRNDPKTQKEHRLIASDAQAIILEQFPMLSDVL